jgi:hypothetical protein
MSRSSRRGRHRLGPPHLRHCRHIPEVEARLYSVDRSRHASDQGTWRVRPGLAVGAGLTALLTRGVITTGEALAQQLTNR